MGSPPLFRLPRPPSLTHHDSPRLCARPGLARTGPRSTSPEYYTSSVGSVASWDLFPEINSGSRYLDKGKLGRGGSVWCGVCRAGLG